MTMNGLSTVSCQVTKDWVIDLEWHLEEEKDHRSSVDAGAFADERIVTLKLQGVNGEVATTKNIKWMESKLPKLIWQYNVLELVGDTYQCKIPLRVPGGVAARVGQPQSSTSAQLKSVPMIRWNVKDMEDEPSTSALPESKKLIILFSKLLEKPNVAQREWMKLTAALQKQQSHDISLQFSLVEQQKLLSMVENDSEGFGCLFECVRLNLFANSLAADVMGLLTKSNPKTVLHFLKESVHPLPESAVVCALRAALNQQNIVKDPEFRLHWRDVLYSVLTAKYSTQNLVKEMENLKTEEALKLLNILADFLCGENSFVESSEFPTCSQVIDWFSLLMDAQGNRLLIDDQLADEFLRVAELISNTTQLMESYRQLDNNLRISAGTSSKTNIPQHEDYSIEMLIFE